MKRCLFILSILLSVSPLHAATLSGSIPVVKQGIYRASFEAGGPLSLQLEPSGGYAGAAIPVVLQADAGLFRDGYFGVLPFSDEDLPLTETKVGCVTASAYQVEYGVEIYRGELGWIKFTRERLDGHFSNDLLETPDLLSIQGSLEISVTHPLEGVDKILLSPRAERWQADCRPAGSGSLIPGIDASDLLPPRLAIPRLRDDLVIPLPDDGVEVPGDDGPGVAPTPRIPIDPDEFFPRPYIPRDPLIPFPIPDGGPGPLPEPTALPTPLPTPTAGPEPTEGPVGAGLPDPDPTGEGSTPDNTIPGGNTQNPQNTPGVLTTLGIFGGGCQLTPMQISDGLGYLWFILGLAPWLLQRRNL